MISIIICSKNKEISSSLANNIQDTVGCEYELIVIDNSENHYSISSAYNTGIAKSKFPYLCFVHDDVEFITKNWGDKIVEFSKLPNVGLIGLAGGKAALRIPYGWTSYLPVVNIIHSLPDKNNVRVDKQELTLINGDTSPQPVVLLDGVFLCANRSLFTKCKFNEKIEGFHCYDLDISMKAFYNGFTNYVVLDIDIKHFSKGTFGTDYINGLFQVYEKWGNELPFIERGCKITPEDLRKLEMNTLGRLRKRLVRSGMKFARIKPIINKYVRQTGSRFDKFMLIFLDIHLFLIKQTSILRKRMIDQN
jgi:glycosyltransferase involved in cell wall biosynthesis